MLGLIDTLLHSCQLVGAFHNCHTDKDTDTDTDTDTGTQTQTQAHTHTHTHTHTHIHTHKHISEVIKVKILAEISSFWSLAY